MAELRKRARCRSEILLKYFAINRKGEYNKTCETCVSKKRQTKPVSTAPSDFKPLKRTDTDFVDGVVSTDIDINSTHAKKTYEEASTTVSESDVVDEQYKHRCSIDATDFTTLVGQHKHKTDVYKLVMKHWERGFKDDYLSMCSNLFVHESEKKRSDR